MNPPPVPKTPTSPELEILRLAVGGDGVARLDGRVVFVAGALPGERVQATIVADRGRFLRAETNRVLRPAPLRRPLDCRHELEDGCGGCGFRHVSSEAALALKVDALMGELAKLGQPVAWPAPSLHEEPNPDGARWRLRLHVGPRGLGLYRRSSRDLVRIPGCLVAHPDLLPAMAALEQAVLRIADRLPEWCLIERDEAGVYGYWPSDPSHGLRSRLEGLIDIGAFRGIRCRGRRPPLELGETWMLERDALAGVPLELHRRAGTFGQANPCANRALRRVVHERLAAARAVRVLDLYAGSGNLTLPAALAGEAVRAVEIDPDAGEGLRASLRASRLTGVEIATANLEAGLDRGSAAFAADAVILDPPRRGAPAVVRRLAELRPRHLLYVSCEPTCLARDAKALAASHEVVALDAFDFFPRTPHVEILAHFRARGD